MMMLVRVVVVSRSGVSELSTLNAGWSEVVIGWVAVVVIGVISST